MRKAFETVTTGNVKTMIDYCTQTRELVNKFGGEVKQLKGMVATREGEIIELKRQLGILQGKIYQNGT